MEAQSAQSAQSAQTCPLKPVELKIYRHPTTWCAWGSAPYLFDVDNVWTIKQVDSDDKPVTHARGQAPRDIACWDGNYAHILAADVDDWNIHDLYWELVALHTDGRAVHIYASDRPNFSIFNDDNYTEDCNKCGAHNVKVRGSCCSGPSLRCLTCDAHQGRHSPLFVFARIAPSLDTLWMCTSEGGRKRWLYLHKLLEKIEATEDYLAEVSDEE